MPEIVEAILNGEWREILVGWEVESNHEGYDVEMIYGSKFDKVGGYTTWAVKRIQQHKAFLYQDDPVEASKKKNENLVYLNLYSGSASKECSHKFAIRDRVRISEFKRKGFW